MRQPSVSYVGTSVCIGLAGQYIAYSDTSDLPNRMHPIYGKEVLGIGGVKKAICEATIQITFLEMGITIDVKWLIFRESIPSLMSMKDMIDNKLDLSFQGRHLKFAGKLQPMKPINYLKIHECIPDNQPYIIYSSTELKRIHTTFGHPSIRTTPELL